MCCEQKNEVYGLNTLHDRSISVQIEKKNAAVPLSFSNNYTHEKNSSDSHDHSDDHQPVCGET